MKVVHLI